MPAPECLDCILLRAELSGARERVAILEGRLRQIALEARDVLEHARHVEE
jgi:hypothetical protein